MSKNKKGDVVYICPRFSFTGAFGRAELLEHLDGDYVDDEHELWKVKFLAGGLVAERLIKRKG